MSSRSRPPYVELRCRSAFSFLEGGSSPEDLVDRASELGHEALALGDRDGLYGAPRFWKASRAAALRPIVGAEATLDGGGRLLLLVESRTGYRNLCRLLTIGHARAPKGGCAVRLDELEEAAGDLVCLAGAGESLLTGALRRRDEAGARALGLRLRSIFGDRLWIDVQRSLDPRVERRTRALRDLAAAIRVPLVATGDVCIARPADRAVQDVLSCLRHHVTLDRAGRLLAANAERHLVEPAAMAARFRDLPGAVSATRRIAERCAFTLENLGYRFPEVPLAPGETPQRRLAELAWAGARTRWGADPSARVRVQVEHELGIIGRLGLAGYFLIVHDIVLFCRERGILVQGRGSAANSAVCYALGITAVDAVGMDLLFERFLS
ncbi:MAG: PHP domain-containing protein [Alphaproteobacteria bacterium]